jgi:hypothetical protein
MIEENFGNFVHLKIICYLVYIMQFDFFSRKKYKCPLCEKGFKTDEELQGHKKTEHEMKGP